MFTERTVVRIAAASLAVSMWIIMLPAPGGPAAVPAGPELLLPGRVEDYVPREEDGVYTFDSLYDLLDGGAEVYRAFNVRRVVSRRYGRSGAPDIITDVFDMGSPADAYGAYHHDLRDGVGVGVGRESDLLGGALAFWKDRYFVSILALDETAETERAVPALARAIAARIPRDADAPGLVRCLPRDDREPAQVTYFHDWTYLNTRHFIAEENLLRLDRETEGVLARYGSARHGPAAGEQNAFLLLLVRYPSAARAQTALESFLAGYLPEADERGVARRTDGGWAAAQRAQDMLVIVLEAARRPQIGRLVSEASAARTREWGR